MNEEKLTCLLVEDDPIMRIPIISALPELTFLQASNLSQARDFIEHEKNISLLLLDLILPDGNGLDFLKELGPQFKIPCIVLTGLNDSNHLCQSFELGAEDFLGKPFSPLELRARVLSKLKKHAQEKKTGVISFANLEIDPLKQKAFCILKDRKIEMNLTFHELKLLSHFLNYPGVIFSRTKLLKDLWSPTVVALRTIDSHIAHLRKKLSVIGAQVNISSLKNRGYTLEKLVPHKEKSIQI